MLGFVLKKFAPQLAELIQKRVQEGTLLYMGRSAGGMVGGSDFALTYEPSPVLTTTLLGKDTTGLALAGKCALRPHIKNHLWDIPSKVGLECCVDSADGSSVQGQEHQEKGKKYQRCVSHFFFWDAPKFRVFTDFMIFLGSLQAYRFAKWGSTHQCFC